MARSLRTILDEANPNKLGPGLQSARAGSMLAGFPRQARVVVASNIGVLPEGAKAAAILSCLSVAGTLTGKLTESNLVTPTTGLVGIDPHGDLIFAAADAITLVEVVYVSREGTIIEEEVIVTTNVGTLLQSKAASVLLSATSLAGTLTGAFVEMTRGVTPTTGQAALNAAGTGVVFAAADAVTSARIRYIAVPGVGISRRALGENLDAVDAHF